MRVLIIFLLAVIPITMNALAAVRTVADAERRKESVRRRILDALGGFAVITETRTVTLPAGESDLRFEGVADGIFDGHPRQPLPAGVQAVQGAVGVTGESHLVVAPRGSLRAPPRALYLRPFSVSQSLATSSDSTLLMSVSVFQASRSSESCTV